MNNDESWDKIRNTFHIVEYEVANGNYDNMELLEPIFKKFSTDPGYYNFEQKSEAYAILGRIKFNIVEKLELLETQLALELNREKAIKLYSINTNVQN